MTDYWILLPSRKRTLVTVSCFRWAECNVWSAIHLWPKLFMAFCFCWIVDSRERQEREGDDMRPVLGNMLHFSDCCVTRMTPLLSINLLRKGMCILVVESLLIWHQSFSTCSNFWSSSLSAAHAQTCPEILRDDLSAGCSSAMNERNCSEVGVYGGPRSLGGENQS